MELTIVVKASFALVDSETMALLPPGEIERSDRTFNQHPTRSVEAAGELAPHLTRCDVTFVGHAFPAPGAFASAARLALFRDGRALIDKTVHVFAERDAQGAPKAFEKMPLTYERAFGGPGVEANPVGRQTPQVVDPQDGKRPASFAPISRFWPARKRLLGALDRGALEAPLAEVPESLPWAYFQAAPPEQQIEYLQGGEWIVMDGLHPTRTRLQTQVPAVRAEARVVIAGGAGGSGAAVALVADTLAIDGDRGRCSVVWRGRYEVAGGEAGLAGLTVLAGLGGPGRSIGWDGLLAASAAAAKVAAAAKAPGSAPPAGGQVLARGTAAEAAGEGTVTLNPTQQLGAASKVVAPFALAAPDQGPVDASATPWAGQTGESRAATTTAMEDTLGAAAGSMRGRTDVGEETVAVTSRSGPATPFAASPSVGGPVSQSGSLAATPWGGAPLVPTNREAVGEVTMGPGGAMGAVPPPLGMVPVSAPPDDLPRAVVAPPPLFGAVAAEPPPTPPPAWSPAAPAPSPISAPAISAPAISAPAPITATTPVAALAPPPPPRPPSLADRLRAAGASTADLEGLMNALNPAPPPPPQD